MHILDNSDYLDDVQTVSRSGASWQKLSNSSIVISGGSGLIGSFLVDVLMCRNIEFGMNCDIHVLGRSRGKAEERFRKYLPHGNFHFIQHDINEPLDGSLFPETVGYVVHLASNTHPVAYATEPISTITANIIGTKNLLDFAVSHKAKRFAFASSNEIYGENRGDTELFDEKYCGYIDCNTLRAGYPESNRCGEALCQADLR